LPFAGEGPGLAEEQQVSSLLAEASSGSNVAGRHDHSSTLKVTERNTNRPLDNQPPGPEAASAAVGGRTQATKREIGGVHGRGELGTGVTLNIDHRPPGTIQTGSQQAVASHARKANMGLPKVQAADQLGIDLGVISQLGDENWRVD
jgi:hypothetical protein